MFENVTFESILQRILDRVPNEIDKREGSMIWNALAPAAVELQEMYIGLDSMLTESFADTASRQYLLKRAAEYGVYPDKESKAILRGEFNIDIPIGSRFSLDHLNYIAIEKISDGVFKMQCETAGAEANQYFGTLIPIEYIDGLTSAQLTELLIPGEDEEGTESFRQVFLSQIKRPATSGNAHHYRQWALEVNGVGDVKVFPLWSGPGTVKVLIVNSQKRSASGALITSVSNYIESLKPIGATLTVVSAQEKRISVSAKINIANGYAIQMIQDSFLAALEDYFREITFKESYISIAKIGNILLNTPGVGDYSNLQLNGGVANVLLNDEEIPVVSTVSLEV
ncbi:baseplate J/gp47 family protein [Schinkia azotoformans]|uniref:baseplate J/gp47 family protein n=1 Tax=Schinkia azotoformans TaxID=1454 RepID=UPI002DB828DD|nr:baseplate J/gp47 family protein [Schinkia azotoformans]MEC1716596.1 baseplate J/gp47 family protein [Schinkia azotoformans]MEC1739434.1 baseplate J/gp47 family protein [Schinkia azotoformans]MEC1745496.1 baseplate J/gp47 family protein [Schinkia azotoformans]MEC1756559.1 baseplate J/gp47 family protein [Schinkia azotoformans]MEC1765826.1 baseplate J/gp47 family protein [Schinkia azotoformans]